MYTYIYIILSLVCAIILVGHTIIMSYKAEARMEHTLVVWCAVRHEYTPESSACTINKKTTDAQYFSTVVFRY